MHPIDRYLPNLKESWLLAIILTIIGGILTLILKLIITYIIPYEIESLDFFLYPVAFIPVSIYIYRSIKKNYSFNKIIPIHDSNFGKIGSIITYSVSIPLVIVLSIIIEPLTYFIKMPDFFFDLIALMERNRIAAILSVVIFAPILEEFLCRGIILRGLLAHTTPINSIIWSATIFAIIHLNPWQAIPAFIFGILIGWIYWKTRSLLLAMFMHAVNNGITISILFLFPDLPKDATLFGLMPLNYYILLYIISLLFFSITIYMMNKYYNSCSLLKIKL